MEEVQNTAAAEATVKSPETITQPTVTEPVAPMANIPTANIEEFNKFVSGQGGFEKAFARWKDMVSNPQPRVEQVPVQRPQYQPQIQQVQPQPAPTQYQEQAVPQGYITQEEYATEQYFRSLANDTKYKGIADQIRSGEVLKEMAEFGIRPTNNTNGRLMFNDGQIRKFLDLKAQTVPAKQTVTPVGNTPTAEWSPIKEVDSFVTAQRILGENRAHPGMQHPMTEAAKDFLKNYFK